MALSTENLDEILWQNPYTMKGFIGTYPACRVKNLPKRKLLSFITNTAHHSKTYGHWNAWVVKDNIVYFFDSFGRSPLDQSFPHDYIDILMNFKKFKYFKSHIQPLDAITCGYYCIHFILHLSSGQNFDKFSNEYLADKNKNDLIVLNIIKSII